LPAAKGTKIHAVRAGKVHFAGEPGDPGSSTYDSRHVVIEVDDPNDGLMYVAYLHLATIDGAMITGSNVVQGQEIGIAGKHKATYRHLHIEFLQGTPDTKAETSRHPLMYLPYSNTANFSAPVADRFNRLGSLMAARLLFGSDSKLEGDLLRVEVDLREGTQVVATRVVDFHNKKTIYKKRVNSDRWIFMNDIGVEGYQKSFMNDPDRLRTDLKYGILVRNIPSKCDNLVARVIDVGQNIVESAEIPVPNQTAVEEFVDFEDGLMPPIGWDVITSTNGSGTTVTNDASAAHSGSCGMLCIDNSTTETEIQGAGIEYILPAGRFEWIAEGWFNPAELNLAENQSIHLLRFLNDDSLSVAARIRNEGGSLLAGIVARDSDGGLRTETSSTVIKPSVWRKWRLYLLRIGTRETTAVLYLDDEEQARLNWDSTEHEPIRLCAGIGLSSAGVLATVLVDELRLTESCSC
jgi:hypothetical protein